MRKIPDIELHLADPKAPKFIDMAEQKIVDGEAQTLLNSLREQKVPTKVQNTNLTQVSQLPTRVSNFTDLDIELLNSLMVLNSNLGMTALDVNALQ